jgi:hypothetical protein
VRDGCDQEGVAQGGEQKQGFTGPSCDETRIGRKGTRPRAAVWYSEALIGVPYSCGTGDDFLSFGDDARKMVRGVRSDFNDPETSSYG